MYRKQCDWRESICGEDALFVEKTTAPRCYCPDHAPEIGPADCFWRADGPILLTFAV